MAGPLNPNLKADSNNFEHQAAQKSSGFVSEFMHFLLHNKKWWLTPIVIILLLVGVLVILGGTAIAPFIYTLF